MECIWMEKVSMDEYSFRMPVTDRNGGDNELGCQGRGMGIHSHGDGLLRGMATGCLVNAMDREDVASVIIVITIMS